MFEKEITKEIESLNWNQNLDQITFASSNSLLSKEKI